MLSGSSVDSSRCNLFCVLTPFPLDSTRCCILPAYRSETTPRHSRLITVLSAIEVAQRHILVCN